MATLILPIQVAPSTPVVGQPAIITLGFITAPGTPGETCDITVTKDGQVQGTGTVTFAGIPAEPVPVVTVGNTGKGWEIQTDAGTLAPTSAPNQFSLV